MNVSRKNIWLISVIFSLILLIFLGKTQLDMWKTQSNSQKFQMLILNDDKSMAYDLLFTKDFYNKLYKFFLVAEMVKNRLKVSQSYSQFFHRDIHRYLNYRSVMTIVCVVNNSDLCDEGWVSKWGSPWLSTLEFSKFLANRGSKIFPNIMSMEKKELTQILEDDKCTNLIRGRYQE